MRLLLLFCVLWVIAPVPEASPRHQRTLLQQESIDSAARSPDTLNQTVDLWTGRISSGVLDVLNSSLPAGWNRSGGLVAQDLEDYLQQALSSALSSCKPRQTSVSATMFVETLGSLPLWHYWCEQYINTFTWLSMDISLYTRSFDNILRTDWGIADKVYMYLDDVPSTSSNANMTSSVILDPTTQQLGYMMYFSHPLLLYYRRDVLESRGLSIPATWDDLLAVSAALNGTDLDGNGEPDFALCLDTAPYCKSHYLLASIMSSVLQSQGTSQGFLLDPNDPSTPWLSNEGTKLALNIWRQLLPYSAPAPEACRPFHTDFLQGRCFATLATEQLLHTLNGTFAWGRTGVAPLPGSSVVYSRTDGTLVECTADTCPYAQLEATLTVSARSSVGTEYADRLVNRAPLRVNQATGVVGSISDDIDTFTYDMVNRIYSWLTLNSSSDFRQDVRLYTQAAPDIPHTSLSFVNLTTAWPQFPRWSPVLKPTSVAPLLHFNASTFVLERGCHPDDTDAFLGTVVWSFAHPNAVPDIILTARMRLALAWAAYNVSSTVPGYGNSSTTAADNSTAATTGSSSRKTIGDADAVISRAVAALDPLVNGSLQILTSQNSKVLRGMYKDAIGSNTPPAPKPPKTNGTTTITVKAGKNVSVIVGVVVPVASTLLLLGLGLWLATMRMRNRNLLGRVVPPGARPGTSLVVTDIQNSTVLWEQLPADVMEAALKVHHATVRGLLAKFNGYESATEGDSFILAFHSPHDAAAWCLAAQQALMAAPWPEQLLQHADACPLWVTSAPAAGSHICKDFSAGMHHHKWLASQQPGSSGLLHHSSSSLILTDGSSSCRDILGLWRQALGRWAASVTTALCCCCRRQRTYHPHLQASASACDRSGGSSGWSLFGCLGGSSGQGGRVGGGANRSRDALSMFGSSSVSFDLQYIPTTASSMNRSSSPDVGSMAALWNEPSAHAGTKCQMPASTLVPADPETGVAAQSAPSDDPQGTLTNAPAAEGLDGTDKPGSSQEGVGKGGVKGGLAGRRHLHAPPPASVPLADAVARTFAPHDPLLSAAERLGAGSVSAPDSRAPSIDAMQRAGQDTGQQTHEQQQQQGSSVAVAAGAATAAIGPHVSFELVPAAADSSGSPAGAVAAGAGGNAKRVRRDDSGLVPKGVKVFQGLRVRMGVHTGVEAADVSLNKASGRVQYSGTALTTAKHVSDVAAGGMVLVSEPCFSHLMVQGSVSRHAWVVHMGEHRLAEGQPQPASLYQLLPHKLAGRLPLYPPIRSMAQAGLGVLSAPVASATIAFMNVVGAQTLLAWDAAVARPALDAFQAIASQQLAKRGGYCVELGDGLCLAAFLDPGAAVCWGLACLEALLAYDWDDQLLAHELCDEIALMVPRDVDSSTSSKGAPTPAPHTALTIGAATGPYGGASRFRDLSTSASGAAIAAATAAGSSGPGSFADGAEDQPSDLGPLQLPAASSRRATKSRMSAGTLSQGQGQGQGGLPFRQLSSGADLSGQAADLSSPSGASASGPDGSAMAAAAGATATTATTAGPRTSLSGTTARASASGGGGVGTSTQTTTPTTTTTTTFQFQPITHTINMASAAFGLADDSLDMSQMSDTYSETNNYSYTPHTSHGTPGLIRRVLMRGLRAKVGLDMGAVLDSLHRATGRMAYRGRVMNRAARICSLAGSGQVLASDSAWRAARRSEGVRRHTIRAVSLGLQKLKGVADKVEVLHCSVKGKGVLEDDVDDEDAAASGRQP